MCDCSECLLLHIEEHNVLLSAVNCTDLCRPAYLVLLSMIFTIPRCFFVLFPTLWAEAEGGNRIIQSGKDPEDHRGVAK